MVYPAVFVQSAPLCGCQPMRLQLDGQFTSRCELLFLILPIPGIFVAFPVCMQESQYILSVVAKVGSICAGHALWSRMTIGEKGSDDAGAALTKGGRGKGGGCFGTSPPLSCPTLLFVSLSDCRFTLSPRLTPSSPPPPPPFPLLLCSGGGGACTAGGPPELSGAGLWHPSHEHIHRDAARGRVNFFFSCCCCCRLF